jgi:hypothetical protein
MSSRFFDNARSRREAQAATRNLSVARQQHVITFCYWVANLAISALVAGSDLLYGLVTGPSFFRAPKNRRSEPTSGRLFSQTPFCRAKNLVPDFIFAGGTKARGAAC